MGARAHDRLQSYLRANGDDQIRLTTQQFSRSNKGTARIVSGAIFNDNVLPLAKTIHFQLCTKGLVITDQCWGCAIAAEKCYSRGLVSLLCTSNYRPHQCCADKADKSPPPHARSNLGTRHSNGSIRHSERARNPLWVKSGYLQRKKACLLTPESGHVWCSSQCLLWANSGHPESSNQSVATHGSPPFRHSRSADCPPTLSLHDQRRLQ